MPAAISRPTLTIFAAICSFSILPSPALATDPASVTLTGGLQSEIGCASDFQPSCAASALVFDSGNQVWQRTFTIPAGDFQYFAALNGSFAETYGLNGGNAFTPVSLSLSSSTPVSFYYDNVTHWLTDNVNTSIAVLAGSFQSEIGCASDFAPGCLRSWLQDPNGDGISTLTLSLPAGNYSTVIAINESFGQTYGLNGTSGGANIDFTAGSSPVLFSYNNLSHILTIDNGLSSAVPEPGTWALMLVGFAAIGLSARRRRKLGWASSDWISATTSN